MKQHRTILSVTGVCLCLVVLQILAPPSVLARTKVQSGETPLLAVTDYTVALPEPVDASKSFILFQFRTELNTTTPSPFGNRHPRSHSWGARFTDAGGSPTPGWGPAR